MKAIREVREEREDVVAFYQDKEVVGINGSVIIEEKIEETTEQALQELEAKLTADLTLVKEKLKLISEL